VNSRRVLVVAHRGASREAPENTLAAFRRAIEAGADAVELDVRLTADGNLAVIHDASVRRTTGARGRVAGITVDDLETLDAGGWFGKAFAGERIPLLEEVVEAASGRAGLFVEVKNPGSRRELVARLVRKALSRFAGEAVVLSFDGRFARLYKGMYPGARVALLAESSDGIKAALDAGLDAAAVGLHSPVPKSTRQRAADAGLGLYVWTVKSFQGFARALGRGADGVITDLPRQARSAIDFIIAAADRQPGGAPGDQEAYLAWRRKFIKQMKRWPQPNR